MANLYALPTPDSPAVLAAECDVRIRASIAAYHRSFGSLAYWGWRLKRMDGYGELGFPSEYDYFLSLNISRSWYYHAVAIGQACAHMSEQELGSIPAGIAELMLTVRPEIRSVYPWADEAKVLSYGQFCRNVEDRNAQVPKPAKTRLTVLSIRVPAGAKEEILKKIDTFKDRQGLKSPGMALASMVSVPADGGEIFAYLSETFGLMEEMIHSRSHAARKREKLMKIIRRRLDEAGRLLNQKGGRDAIREAEMCTAQDRENDQDDSGRAQGNATERSRVSGT